jgi:hypothetical protein
MGRCVWFVTIFRLFRTIPNVVDGYTSSVGRAKKGFYGKSVIIVNLQVVPLLFFFGNSLDRYQIIM